MRRLFSFLAIILQIGCSFAIGEWAIFPTSMTFSRGEILDSKIYLLSGETLFSVEEEQLENIKYYNRLTGLNGTNILDIIVSPSAQRLVVVYTNGNIDFLDADGNVTNLPDYANKVIMGDRTIKGISERDGKLYIITGFGFMIVDIAKAEFEETFNYNISEYKDGTLGIRTTTISEEQLKELNNKVGKNGVGSTLCGGLCYNDGILVTTNIDPDFRNSAFEANGIISIYDIYEDQWKIINPWTVNAQTDGTTKFNGPTCIALDPRDNQHFFIGTGNLGLFEFQDGKLKNCYNAFNSSAVDCILPNTYTSRVSSMAFDDNGNLWYMNVAVNNPLRCITPSGESLSFQINGYRKINSAFDKMLIARNDPYHFKWSVGINPWQNCQVGIYYDAGTLADKSDDRSVSFTTLTDQDGNIYNPNYFNDIVEDNNGAVWLLTSSGPFVFDSQIEAFNNPGKVRRVKIPRNDGTNLADYLLAGVDCFCMTVDAANRKWIGTKEAGLYLLSADGITQLEHFTAANSPLPSDNIIALAYDEFSGTLYISCEGGIVSYVTDAIRGADNYSNVICYPNPVRPEYSGPLHITGLKDNTRVRICDINNNVIYSTISEGGCVSWDLVDDSGSRVKSGIYIVYGTNTNGSGGVVTKFMVI